MNSKYWQFDCIACFIDKNKKFQPIAIDIEYPQYLHSSKIRKKNKQTYRAKSMFEIRSICDAQFNSWHFINNFFFQKYWTFICWRVDLMTWPSQLTVWFGSQYASLYSILFSILTSSFYLIVIVFFVRLFVAVVASLFILSLALSHSLARSLASGSFIR